MPTAVDAQNLTFGYRSGHALLRDWQISVSTGESVAIVGQSGSGKSTILYLLGAMARPWSGSLAIMGADVIAMNDGARSDLRARRIGFVFQDALLDSRRSVLGNVLEGAIYRGESRKDARDRALALLDELRVSVEPGRIAANPSGGEAQRIALCRALLGRPTLILADEPTGNLDRRNGAAVESCLLDQTRAGSAVIVVTHDERLARRCDRLVRL